MTFAWRRITAALTCWPDRAGWFLALRELCWCAPVVGLIAWAGGFARFDPLPFDGTWLRLFFLLMVIPALGEELLFRVLPVPRPEQPFALWQAGLAVAAFVAWHPLQVFTFGPPWSALFLDPLFLAATALLGVALVRTYRATGSIWPCAAVHWLVVAGWKLFFGGPFA